MCTERVTATERTTAGGGIGPGEPAARDPRGERGGPWRPAAGPPAGHASRAASAAAASRPIATLAVAP
ncbi:MAG: hypothetical protein D6689_09700 [Deltaproteobacteria bacterium]|nr:MAG: hypothetical protein D6689_09700 [Deltaproteobacteria bacterium]